MVRIYVKVQILATFNYCKLKTYNYEKDFDKNLSVYIRIYINFFRNSQNKRPAIIKDKLGLKLNLGLFQCEWSREWKYSLSGKNNTLCGDAGSKPALHSFYPHLSFSHI